MSQEERYGTRDQTYSAWHRRGSTSRFVGMENAQQLAMIDIDVTLYVEYNDKNKQPIILIETAIDVGQNRKSSTVTKNLAKKAGIPALCVLYTIDEHAINPADPKHQHQDIKAFRVQRLYPVRDAGTDPFYRCNPQQYAEMLIALRRGDHQHVDDILKNSDRQGVAAGCTRLDAS